jgi:type IV pilus assembly protein PilM
MAATTGVWALDIGQCALKALRCEYDSDQNILIATHFDYIEHPKILSQPDADPKQLIQEALTQFLARNKVKGDRVAVAVPGQNGLARFFTPPPVDRKRLPEIVRFEAKQQIPFPLEEVIWDFQQMGGVTEVDGFIMETEIGLFAMKRDQVYDFIEPFVRAGVELDIIQLAPLGVYNFVAHNLLVGASEVDYDPDNPPESFVVLSLGTETTDLVITNGYRVWQRNIPLGGNHFTKQLTKDLKLTFAKAEHLKRNVREAEDAKAVIQAMRPVFNDLLSEVQRSIGFFQNIDRKAEIAGMILLGNAVKLPGLQQYLSKNLGYEVINVDHQRWAARLAGPNVLTAPQFKENMHAFGICYGLCLQGLGKAKLRTNLLPREITTARIIRAKRPWAVVAAAGLMLAFAVNFFFEYREWYEVHPKHQVGGVDWETAKKQVDDAQALSTRFDTEDKKRVDELERLVAIGEELSGNSDRRLLWLELMRAVNLALPQDANVVGGEIPDPRVKPISQRKDLHIEYIETEYYEDLKNWFSEPVRRKYLEGLLAETGALARRGALGAAASAAGAKPGTDTAEKPPTAAPAATAEKPPAASPAAAPSDDELAKIKGPEGPGWVIEIRGYHFYNDDPLTWAGTHVRNTFLKNLREMTVELPTGPSQPPMTFTMEELGIGYAILAREERIEEMKIKNPFYEPPAGTPGVFGEGGAMPGGLGLPAGIGGLGVPGAGPPAAAPGATAAAKAKPKEDKENPMFFDVSRYRFVVQFCWQEQQLTQRLRKRREAEQPKEGSAPAEKSEKVAVAPTGG